jgi:hypothetical protein
LNVDGIEADRVDDRAEVCVGEHALRGSSEVVLLRGTVVVRTDTVRERGEASAAATLDIKINTVENCAAEGTGRAGTT